MARTPVSSKPPLDARVITPAFIARLAKLDLAARCFVVDGDTRRALTFCNGKNSTLKSQFEELANSCFTNVAQDERVEAAMTFIRQLRTMYLWVVRFARLSDPAIATPTSTWPKGGPDSVSLENMQCFEHGDYGWWRTLHDSLFLPMAEAKSYDPAAADEEQQHHVASSSALPTSSASQQAHQVVQAPVKTPQRAKQASKRPGSPLPSSTAAERNATLRPSTRVEQTRRLHRGAARPASSTATRVRASARIAGAAAAATMRVQAQPSTPPSAAAASPSALASSSGASAAVPASVAPRRPASDYLSQRPAAASSNNNSQRRSSSSIAAATLHSACRPMPSSGGELDVSPKASTGEGYDGRNDDGAGVSSPATSVSSSRVPAGSDAQVGVAPKRKLVDIVQESPIAERTVKKGRTSTARSAAEQDDEGAAREEAEGVRDATGDDDTHSQIEEHLEHLDRTYKVDRALLDASHVGARVTLSSKHNEELLRSLDAHRCSSAFSNQLSEDESLSLEADHAKDRQELVARQGCEKVDLEQAHTARIASLLSAHNIRKAQSIEAWNTKAADLGLSKFRA